MHAAFVTRGHVMIPLGFRPCLQTVPTARAMQCTLTCLRMVYMALMRSSSWTSMFMVMLYTNIDMHAQQPPMVVRVDIKSTTWPQYKYGILPRVHEHAGSSATHLSLVAHHPFEYRHASAWPIRYKGSAYWGSSRSTLAFYMYVNPVL